MATKTLEYLIAWALLSFVITMVMIHGPDALTRIWRWIVRK